MKIKLKRNIVIDIKDSHDTDGEIMDMEMSVVGTLEGMGDDYLITYTEHSGELKGCVTSLKVQGKCVTMTRTGDYASQLIIEQDKRHNCYYSTPHGDFMMGVFAKSVDSDMKDNGGTLSFEYTLDFNADFSSKNKLIINVKEILQCQN